MQRTMIGELARHVGGRVRLEGWIHAVRKLSRIWFLVLRDRTGTTQLVARPGTVPDLGLESVVRVTGTVVENAEAPGGLEVAEPAIEVLVAVDEALPVPLGPGLAQAKLPALLEHAPTVLRDPERRAVFRLAAAAMRGFRRTLDGMGFTEIQTPKLVGGATETGANVFSVPYFGETAYLAQSPQLYKQMMVGVFERVYEVGPVFRAEPHATVRHLAEYVSLDVELGFIAGWRDVVAVLRAVLAGIFAELQEVEVPPVPIELPCIAFAAAQELVGGEGDDLTPASERALGQWAQREHGSDFLVVSGYPRSKRPFYTMPEGEASTASFDLLFRGTELVTGGQRIHGHAMLQEAMAHGGIEPAALGGYLEAFRYGMPPHGGFAIGLERLLAQLLGAPNIRLTTLFPRDRTRLSP